MRLPAFITLWVAGVISSGAQSHIVAGDSCMSVPAADETTVIATRQPLEALSDSTHGVSHNLAALPALPIDSIFTPELRHHYGTPSLYDYPYSTSRSMPRWGRLMVNTGVLMGAGVAMMGILESLPKDATAWNKKENAKTPMFRRWIDNVTEGPVWDKDNPVFNYILHPYAGAAYYMGARSCGFNIWGSFVYSFCISTFFWEYGFESFNEIPSVQDLIITPVVGSLVGEGFYLIKRKIVNDGYRLWGSRFMGYFVAFLVDPLNETIGYFRGDQLRQRRRTEALHSTDPHRGLTASSWLAPSSTGLQYGISLTYNF